MVTRRHTLGLLGTAAAGIGLTTGVSAADEGDRPTTSVAPFFDQKVPTGNAIEHYIGWVESCGTPEERRARVEAFLDSVELTVNIEGIDVEDPSQYWNEPVQEGEETYVWWRFETEPRPPGVYDFDMTLEFSKPFTTLDENCEEEVRSGVDFVGETVYEVTPDAGAGKSE